MPADPRPGNAPLSTHPRANGTHVVVSAQQQAGGEVEAEKCWALSGERAGLLWLNAGRTTLAAHTRGLGLDLL